jgi:hypothetical protein
MLRVASSLVAYVEAADPFVVACPPVQTSGALGSPTAGVVVPPGTRFKAPFEAPGPKRRHRQGANKTLLHRLFLVVLQPGQGDFTAESDRNAEG